jgi:hypothetical protein
MNYLKHYCNLIRKAENRISPEGYTEKHHTFPVSIFGKNKRIVVLTAREHYIAHALLEKAFIKRYGLHHYRTQKMNFAHSAMKCKNQYTNSYLYENARKRRTEIMKEQKMNCGEKNPMYGRKHSPETIEKMIKVKKETDIDIIFSRTSNAGKKAYEMKVGVHNRTKEQIKKDSSKGGQKNIETGQIIELGKEMGQKHYENGTGIFSLTEEQKFERSSKGGKISGKIVSSQRWICLETGHISTPGGLARFQNARGIDTSKRKRIA